MENFELQKIWKTVDSELESKSEGELQKIIESKTRKTIWRFYISYVVIFLITAGYFSFLTISLINRWDDFYLRLNNFAIGIISIVALVSEVFAMRLLREKKSALPLKEWVEKSMSFINRELKQRISYLVIPIIAIPTILSINVYFSQNTFIELFKDEEQMYGLTVGFIIGMMVSYYFVFKYRKYQLKNFEYLKGLYNRICEVA